MPAITLPAGLALRDLPASDDRRGWRGWIAPAMAALLHAVVLVSLLWDWRIAASTHDEAPIPVTILFVPPPRPAPAPEASPPLIGRESGKDQRTTAPPAADAVGAEATRPPQAQPAPSHAQDRAKAEPHKEAARRDARKEADKARAPRIAPMPLVMLDPGDRAQTGDPYLNHARDLLERHRVYPKVIGQFGLPVEGTPVYAALIDRAGALRGLKLVQPSGAAALDEAGAAMIRATAPFPPLPGNYPGDTLVMTITIHLFPSR